jgi:hypothetical protein
LAAGTVGDCASCHGQANSASGAYSFLQGRGYINGKSTKLASSGSCLTWFGGNMPPSGPAGDPQAVTDMTAWVAAGALNN